MSVVALSRADSLFMLLMAALGHCTQTVEMYVDCTTITRRWLCDERMKTPAHDGLYNEGG